MFINMYSINMYKQNLALNNLQGLICHKTQANLTTENDYSQVTRF